MSTAFDTPDPGDLLEIENLTQVFDPINALEDGSAQWAGNTGGSADAYTASITPAPASLTAGLLVKVRIHAANTGASTLNLNGLGATAIRLLNAALAGGELAANATYILIYDGTYWQIIGGGGSGGSGGSVAIGDITDWPAGVDATEVGYLNGVTSAIQTQLDSKAASSHTHAASAITSGELALAQGGTGADLSATGGSGQYVKQNSAGGVLTVGTISASDLPSSIDAAKIADGSVSNTEFQYIGGVTSDVQTQLNAKPNISLLTTAGDIIYRDGSGWQRLPIGTAGQVLKVNSGADAPEWGGVAAGDLPTGIDAAKIADGSVSNTEFQYLGSVTSNIQTQLNAKEATITTLSTTKGGLGLNAGSSDGYPKFASGTVTIGNIAASDLPTGIDAAKLADGSVSNTELQYINSVTSNVQTQLDAKVALSTLTTAGDLAYRDGSTWTRLPIGTAGQVLKVNSGATAPEWGAASGGSAALTDLTDVTITTPAEGEVLRKSAGDWVNAALTASDIATGRLARARMPSDINSNLSAHLVDGRIRKLRSLSLASGENDLGTPASGKRWLLLSAHAVNPTGGSITLTAKIKNASVYWPGGAGNAIGATSHGQILASLVALPVFDNTDTLSIHASASGAAVEVSVLEFADTSALKSAKLWDLSTGHNTLYTCPSGYSAVCVGARGSSTIPYALSPYETLYYRNDSGGTRTYSWALVDSGDTPDTPGAGANALQGVAATLSTGNLSAIGQGFIGFEAGDYLSINVDSGTGSQAAWTNLLEVLL